MRYIVVLFLFVSSISSKAQEISNKINIHIHDINFELFLIKKGFDSGKPDGKVWLSNIENIEKLDLAWNEPKVSNLDGIEYFKNLKVLFLDHNNLQELDVSHNLKLEVLGIGGNEISELNLLKNTELKNLYLYDHDAGSSKIKTIDLSNNIKLETLYADSYVTEFIDLSYNTALKELHYKAPWRLAENQGIKSLDISKNKQLEILVCNGNQLEQLDVSHNPKLKYLACSNNKLTGLNLTKNRELKELFCSDNPIQYLDCSQNNQLKDLWCSKSLTRCIAALPTTTVYYIENHQVVEAKGVTEVLDEDCTK